MNKIHVIDVNIQIRQEMNRLGMKISEMKSQSTEQEEVQQREIERLKNIISSLEHKLGQFNFGNNYNYISS